MAQAEEIRMLRMQMGGAPDPSMMFGMPSTQQLMQMQQFIQQQMFQQMFAASTASSQPQAPQVTGLAPPAKPPVSS